MYINRETRIREIKYNASMPASSIILGFLLPRREGVKGDAISGGLRQIGRLHVRVCPPGF